MAENATLSKLCKEPMQHIDGFEVTDQLYVDFTGASHVKDITGTATADSAYNLTANDYFTAFKLPKGALITSAGWIVHTTEATVEFALDTEGGTGGEFHLKTAATMGAQYVSTIVDQTATEIIPNDSTSCLVRVTGSAANCTAAIVTFFVKYIIIKRQSA